MAQFENSHTIVPEFHARYLAGDRRRSREVMTSPVDRLAQDFNTSIVCLVKTYVLSIHLNASGIVLSPAGFCNIISRPKLRPSAGKCLTVPQGLARLR